MIWSKANVLRILKWKFSVFCIFWVTKLKLFSGKVRQSIKNCLNANLVMGTFLENEASLSSRTNIMGLWKQHLLVFCKFLSDEVETVFVKARECCENFLHKVCFVGSCLENVFQSLFDHSRQSLLEFLNISNALNVSIWIFNSS